MSTAPAGQLQRVVRRRPPARCCETTEPRTARSPSERAPGARQRPREPCRRAAQALRGSSSRAKDRPEDPPVKPARRSRWPLWLQDLPIRVGAGKPVQRAQASRRERRGRSERPLMADRATPSQSLGAGADRAKRTTSEGSSGRVRLRLWSVRRRLLTDPRSAAGRRAPRTINRRQPRGLIAAYTIEPPACPPAD